MKLGQKSFSLLFPRLVEEYHSPINGTIQIKEFGGKYAVTVGGLTQAGSLITRLWQPVIKKVAKQSPNITSILLLGLGPGCLIPLLKRHWPLTTVTGIELDSMMIEIGRKYFKLSYGKNLNIITADAFSWIKTINQTIDLVIIDLFIGKKNPARIASPHFIKILSHHLTQKGTIIFNCYHRKHNQETINKLITQLSQSFPPPTVYKTPTNTFLVSITKPY